MFKAKKWISSLMLHYIRDNGEKNSKANNSQRPKKKKFILALKHGHSSQIWNVNAMSRTITHVANVMMIRTYYRL